MQSKRLVFTGGHHTGALEVAKRLKGQGYEIFWLGHRQSMWGDTADSAEYKDVTAAGIPFYGLKAGKFHHTYNPLKLIRIPWGFIQSFSLLLSLRPNLIVSFGGYLAVPVVIMGWLLGIKSVTHEQTVVAGWANKLISHFASKIALSWPDSMQHYPQDKTVLVGLPVRPEILKIKSQIANNKSLKPSVFITGGKQGAHVINEAVFANISALTNKFKIIHQTGSSTVFGDYAKAREIKIEGYQCFDYDQKRYNTALAKCDVVVGRAGAHTVYELGVLGKRSVLVPIPWVSHNEQYLNAKYLADHNLCVILSEDKLSPEALLESINKCLMLKPKVLNLALDGIENMCKLISEEL